MTGKYFDELQVGQRFVHPRGRTITEADNTFFSTMTMNPQPLHLDEHFSSQTQFGQRIVNGLLTLSLAVGLTVGDLTEGTVIANLGYDRVVHPNPVFHGDTLYVESEVLEKVPSRSKPDRGVIRLKHTGRKPDGTIVVEFERTALFRRNPAQPTEE